MANRPGRRSHEKSLTRKSSAHYSDPVKSGEASGPGMLSGIKVLDFTQYLAGPTVTRLMAEMGADIIKVEIAPMGDPARLLPTIKAGRSGYFVQQNRGKKSLCLDWQHPQALEIL